MKIAIGTTRPFHLFHLGRELSKLGHEVTVYSYIPDAYTGKYGIGTSRHITVFNASKILASLALQKKVVSFQQFATERLFSRVDEYIATNLTACDAYIGLSGMALASLVAARKLGAIAICDRGASHIARQITVAAETGQSISSTEYIYRELRGYSISDFIAVPSIYSQDTFLQQGVAGNRLFLNNYGVDLNRFTKQRPRLTKTLNRLLFVGPFSYRKGADLLVRLLDMLPSITITHVGTPGDVEMPSSTRFNSVGPVANSKLSEIYRANDIFVFPSRDDGFGMVLLEAIACGLTVVASRYCGARDIQKVAPTTGQGIIIFQDYSIEELVNSIKKAIQLTHQERSDDEAADLRESFSWAAYALRYERFLKESIEAAN